MIRVVNKVLYIPIEDRSIAAAGDNNSVQRDFLIKRKTADEKVDLAGLNFKLCLKYMDTGAVDIANLEKEESEEEIRLTWTITDIATSHLGTVLINIKAYNEDGHVRWHSYQGAVYIEGTIGYQIPSDKLTAYEELEQKIKAETKKLLENEDEIIENETKRKIAEQNRVKAENEREKDCRDTIKDFNKTKTELKNYADMSKSYAVGGTGTRENEDDDNAQYYAEQSAISASSSNKSKISANTAAENAIASAGSAKTSENEAKSAKEAAVAAGILAQKDAKKAQEYAGKAEKCVEPGKYVALSLDKSDGHLYEIRGKDDPDVTFRIKDNKRLEVIIE